MFISALLMRELRPTKLSNLYKDRKLINGKDGILSAVRAGALHQYTKLASQVRTS